MGNGQTATCNAPYTVACRQFRRLHRGAQRRHRHQHSADGQHLSVDQRRVAADRADGVGRAELPPADLQAADAVGRLQVLRHQLRRGLSLFEDDRERHLHRPALGPERRPARWPPALHLPRDAGCRNVQTSDTNTDIQVANTPLGRSHVAVVRFDKEFDWGLSLSGSYTYEDVKDVSNATSSVATSLYNAQAVVDPNNASYGTSSDETKWQFKYNVGYDHAFFGDYRTVFQLFGETRAGRPYSFTMNDTSSGRSAVFGTTGNSNHYLLYVPTGPNDPKVSYDSAATQTALDTPDQFDRTRQIPRPDRAEEHRPVARQHPHRPPRRAGNPDLPLPLADHRVRRHREPAEPAQPQLGRRLFGRLPADGDGGDGAVPRGGDADRYAGAWPTLHRARRAPSTATRTRRPRPSW